MTPAADRDGRLVESLRPAEPTAAEELVASYGGRAFRLAIGITGNRADAEEVVQDALWTVMRPGYEINLLYIAGLVALILGGAGPLSIDAMRRRRRQRHLGVSGPGVSRESGAGHPASKNQTRARSLWKE
jgi:DNA-directed RNA polymerase specialized sigma24 family protein